MIDIIIPIYNAKDTLPLTLMSISLQKVNFPFKVTLVDDCSDDDYSDIIKDFKDKLDIQYLRLPKNSGSGVSRQYGIEHTNYPYITFIDGDDLFYNTDSLYTMYHYIQNEYDMVSFTQYDEARNIYFINEGDIHGKIYLREYIEKNNIYFNETRFHEDNFFNNYMLLTGAKNYNNNQVVYIYCDNEKSITKVGKDKTFERLEILLSNMKELLDKIPLTDDNTSLIEHYLFIKYRNLNRSYQDFSIEQKKQFNLWIKKYHPTHIQFIGILNDSKLEEMIHKYLLEIK